MQGFAVALQPMNLLWCFVGVLLGTLVGVMPGLGPPATIAMLLPLTFLMNPASAIIMLAGIYYGAKYGGSTTSILLNVPGESASVATCLDGYQMARKGRAGAALGIAAIASFIAGTVGVLGLMLIAPPLAQRGARLQLAGILRADGARPRDGGAARRATRWSRRCSRCWSACGSPASAPTSSARPRASPSASWSCSTGIDFVVVAIGIFAIGEVLANMEERGGAQASAGAEGAAQPAADDAGPEGLRASPSLNGSVVGFIIGVLPGAGSTVASFISYGIEKAVSKHPEKFGKGVIEGVAAPEGANNSETGGALSRC